MHADCKLEPLGKAPSGSVCLVHQSAFSEVPVTALDPHIPPHLRDWLLLEFLPVRQIKLTLFEKRKW